MSSAENKNGRKGKPKAYVSTVIDAPIEAVWATAGRRAEFDEAAVEQAIEQGVYTSAFNSLRKAAAV
ncbi:uncharacterized protein ACA1_034340 [Acanthamoeba castellanii str. Neff]|uniref:Uncharacterized protein n=1 Tax=Acanthamoeba castellanii (strain ATCC 30010 / Neff) TaxID=1257118 RepID=L8HBP4_ACACF|nr:uncharacterized protein ACA1_034340 [Acanthamoeba castellanii str. Neff]ELR22600.1 hypothetical protein ACA1_034340 [Acanthamoeba castellanii str. Neff]